MDEYDVVWSRESIYDAADITDYIEFRFGQERADQFLHDINYAVESLETGFRYYSGTGIYYRQKVTVQSPRKK